MVTSDYMDPYANKCFGSWRVVRKLSAGGMSVVYEAFNDEIERQAAIKILASELSQSKEFLQRLRNEAKIVNKINNPSIVKSIDSGISDDNIPYIVMEYVDGRTLAELIAENRDKFQIETAIRLMQQAADAFEAAHQKGIVHRDIKPGNLMVTADSAVPGKQRMKIIDFGISKALEGASMTMTQRSMGSPAYMSPIQFEDMSMVGPKDDVYSFGVTFFEVLTGELPFLSDSPFMLHRMHKEAQPPSLLSRRKEAPTALADLVHRMLAKDTAARPTMAEVSQVLNSLLEPVNRSQVPTPSLPSSWMLIIGSIFVIATTLFTATQYQKYAAKHPSESVIDMRSADASSSSLDLRSPHLPHIQPNPLIFLTPELKKKGAKK